MANFYKVLGQVATAATTDTDLYTVPASRSAVVSTITVANRSAVSVTFRIAIRPAGAGIASQHYIAYDSTVTANNTVALTLGVTLATTDVITVYASTANLTFNAFGTEIS